MEITGSFSFEPVQTGSKNHWPIWTSNWAISPVLPQAQNSDQTVDRFCGISMDNVADGSALYLHEITIILRHNFTKLVMFPFGIEIHRINGIQTREAIGIIVVGIIYFNISNSLHNQQTI